MVQREPFENERWGYISIGSDITEIKMHEKELELKKEMYGFMVEAINGVVFDWDLQERKIDYSINPNRNLVPNHFLKSSNEQDALIFLDNQNHNDFKKNL